MYFIKSKRRATNKYTAVLGPTRFGPKIMLSVLFSFQYLFKGDVKRKVENHMSELDQ